DDLLDELGQLRINRRLAAADRHYRRLGDFDRLEAFVDREPILELARVSFDGAADAGEIAGVQGLEHQNERIAFASLDRIANLVLDRVRHDVDRKSHAHSLAQAETVLPDARDGLPNPRGMPSCPERQGPQRKVSRVKMIAEVEDFRKARACPEIVPP